MSRSTSSPCYGCTDRYPCCHDTCPDYKEWREALDQKNARRRQAIFERSFEDQHLERLAEKNRRKK